MAQKIGVITASTNKAETTRETIQAGRRRAVTLSTTIFGNIKKPKENKSAKTGFVTLSTNLSTNFSDFVDTIFLAMARVFQLL